MDAELDKLEEELNKLSPLGMPDDMISRLDNAMARWHEQVPVEEKIVPLNQGAADEERNWLGWKSVAAVAVMGAGMAFFAGSANPSAEPVATSSPTSHSYQDISTAAFTPSDARAKLVSANNIGMYMTKSGHPLRCLEVNSKKTFLFQNEIGEKVRYEIPVKEVLLVPAAID